MDLYERIENLCKNKGISLKTLCDTLEISRSSLSELKAGRCRSISSFSLKKIADFFGVSTDYLLGSAETSSKELNEYLEVLSSREELRMLFKLAKNASKSDVKRAVKIIEALKNSEDHNAGRLH